MIYKRMRRFDDAREKIQQARKFTQQRENGERESYEKVLDEGLAAIDAEQAKGLFKRACDEVTAAEKSVGRMCTAMGKAVGKAGGFIFGLIQAAVPE